MPDQNNIVMAIGDGRAHYGGIGVERSGAVLEGQVHDHHIMARFFEERRQVLPAPGAVVPAVHQGEGRHAQMVGRQA
jgi:hypothetical protein